MRKGGKNTDMIYCGITHISPHACVSKATTVSCKLLVCEALGYPTLVFVHIFFSYPSELDLSEIAAIASGDLERDCNSVQQSHPQV